MPTRPTPDDKMAAAELAFFTKALATFAKSAAKFDVVCSVRNQSAATTTGAGPSPLSSPLVPPARQRSQIHTLVILDSSFNPPTVAHMQMATSAIRDLRQHHQQTLAHPASMRLLLLLSVNNADKAPKPAAFEQRLALMLAMAQDMHAILGKEAEDRQLDIPIDIGLASEPYFHSKSNAIAASPFYVRMAFPSAPDSKTTPDQVFLVGYDTLIRIFDPKYYPASSSSTTTTTGPPPAPLPEGLPADATPMQIALTPLMRRARLRVTTRPDDQWGDEDAQRQWVDTIVEERGGPTEHWAAKIELLSGTYKGSTIVSSTMAREAAQAQDWRRLGEQVGPAVASWVETQKLYSEP